MLAEKGTFGDVPVGVAQSGLEHQVVALGIAGSNPVVHPNVFGFKQNNLNVAAEAPVAQLDRAVAFEAKGWVFKSPRARRDEPAYR